MANLSKVSFNNTILKNATLEQANLRGIFVNGWVDLRGANLNGAKVRQDFPTLNIKGKDEILANYERVQDFDFIPDNEEDKKYTYWILKAKP